MSMGVAQVRCSSCGVDTLEDVRKIEHILKERRISEPRRMAEPMVYATHG